MGTIRGGAVERGDREQRIEAVLGFARSCHYEEQHSHQVTKLALQLFDELEEVHGLGEEERWFLECGALLHDIGWIEGQQAHHKTALRMIIAAEALPFGKRERRMVGLVARYHRKALPNKGHAYYGDLKPGDRRRVCLLGGMLRIADGLDRGHAGAIRGVTCTMRGGRIRIRCESFSSGELEAWGAERKSALLSDTLGHDLVFKVVEGRG